MAGKQHPGNTNPAPKKSFQAAILAGQISQSDGAEALEYIQEETGLKGWKPGTVNRQYQAIKPFLIELRANNLTLDQLTKKEVLSLITYLQNKEGWSEDTKQTNWDWFARFYQWGYRKHGGKWNSGARDLMMGDAVLGKKRWKHKKDRNKIKEKDTFTVAEVLEIVSAEPELCYKTFFGVTFEAGMRIGEALSLQIKDVTKTQHGHDLNITKSKTEARVLFIEKYFTAYLDKWLQVHPDRHNKEAPLFFNSQGRPLEQKAANKRLQETCKALFPHKRKVSLHSLRHSWATETATYFTEAQMCKFFGWRIGSNMPATYIRKQKIDVRQTMRRAHGLEQPKSILEAGRRCANCAHVNPPDYDYCDQCKLPLDPERLARIKQQADVEALLKQYVSTEFRSVIEQLKTELRNKGGTQ